MSVLRPTTGALWDRRIVLGLKIETNRRPHFLQELGELTEAISRRQMPAANLLDCLREIHQEMFGLLDAIRGAVVTEENAMELARKAVHLQQLNLQRYQIVEDIDLEAGEFAGKEK